ncbi:MAG: hypothetical protein WA857_02720 [Candidatus Acidiferrum sp.]
MTRAIEQPQKKSGGYPEDWFALGKSATTFYPNQQGAAALFYHDHPMGTTRLKGASGLAGLHLIRDEFENRLNLPMGPQEIPLMIFDRSFRAQDGRTSFERIR